MLKNLFMKNGGKFTQIKTKLLCSSGYDKLMLINVNTASCMAESFPAMHLK